MINIYGLKNCDTCRKAWKWMDAENIAYQFLDVRKDGITESQVQSWADAVGWDVLLNKRGTTWRGLPVDVKDNVDQASAIKLMAGNPALIKRPVFEKDGEVTVGFTAKTHEFLKT